jgi:hypothetical protein
VTHGFMARFVNVIPKRMVKDIQAIIVALNADAKRTSVEGNW